MARENREHKSSYEVVNMLMEKYDYEMDMEVKCEEAADKKFVQYVEKLSKNLHLSIEEVCKNMDEPYEKYLRIKQNL